MLHTGLFGGVAAGGPPAASPLSLPETSEAPASETPVDLDALARAFGELMDVFEQKPPAAEPTVNERGETPTLQTMVQAVSILPEIFDFDDDPETDDDTDTDPFFDAGTIDVDSPDDDDQGDELLTWLVATDVPPPAVAPALKSINGDQPAAPALPRVPVELPKLPVHFVHAADDATEQPAVARTDVPPTLPDAELSSTTPQHETKGNPDQTETARRASRQVQVASANVPPATSVSPFNIAPFTHRDSAPHEISSHVRKPAVTAARTVAVIAPASLPAAALRLPTEVQRETNTAAPEQVPSSTSNQIVQSLRLALSRHGGEAHIKLDPAQFGDLSVAMRVDRGQVVARVEAGSPAVREWLQANRDALRAGLGEHNLRLDRLDITTTEEARGSRERDGDRQSGEEGHPQPRRQRKPSSGETFDIVA